MLIIGIAGGTGSGKTTVVSKLKNLLSSEDYVVIPQDAYYKDCGHLTAEQKAVQNFDHPDSIDFDYLIEHLNELKEGRPVDQPVYSYVTCERSKTEVVRVNPAHIIIVEGILIFTCEKLREMMDIKVFVDADADDRLSRVISRDIVERGKNVDQVLRRYEQTVKPMHLQYIEPTKRYADIIIPQGGHNQVAVNMLHAIIEKGLKNK
jgi:uridine kinase